MDDCQASEEPVIVHRFFNCAMDVVVRITHQGDGLGFAATQKPVEFTGIAIVRVKDGQIVEAWNNFDFMSMGQQLGTI